MSLTPFIEARLLDEVSYGFRSAFMYGRTITDLRNGNEIINIRWDQPRYRFVAPYGNITKERLEELLDVAHVTRLARGFRFKDWSDFTIEGQEIAVGTGAEQTVQVVKTRALPVTGEIQNRIIRKPVADTLQLSAPGGLAGVSLDTTTGLLTFTADLGDTVTIDYLEFDVPVRFLSDEFVSQYVRFNGLRSDVELIEFRGWGL